MHDQRERGEQRRGESRESRGTLSRAQNSGTVTTNNIITLGTVENTIFINITEVCGEKKIDKRKAKKAIKSVKIV